MTAVLEKQFLATATRVTIIRRALVQASAVLTQPLRERLNTFTDSKWGLNSNEVTGLITAIIDEGTSALQLQLLTQDGGECDVSPFESIL